MFKVADADETKKKLLEFIKPIDLGLKIKRIDPSSDKTIVNNINLVKIINNIICLGKSLLLI